MDTNEESQSIYGWKIVGVAGVQAIGSFFSLLLLFLNGRVWGTMPEISFWIGFSILIVLLGLSIAVGLKSEPVLDLFGKTIAAFLKREIIKSPRKANKKSLIRILHIFATSDFLAVGYCVLNTGGAEISVYSPFLFIIVPILIIVKVLHWRALLLYAGVSGLIFLIALCPLAEKVSWPFMIGSVTSHKCLLAASTIVCTLFPVLYAILEQWAETPTPVAADLDTVGHL